MSVFKKGDHVRSNTTAQGLREGTEYLVLDVAEPAAPVRGFTIYTVSPVDGDEVLAIQNGHLLFDSAPACIDCKGPATVYRDLGRGIYSCAPCEAAHRSRRNS